MEKDDDSHFDDHLKKSVDKNWDNGIDFAVIMKL